MSLAKKNLNTETVYLDNTFWNREVMLGGMVVLHTINCQKISNQIVKNLNDKDFSLQDMKRK